MRRERPLAGQDMWSYAQKKSSDEGKGYDSSDMHGFDIPSVGIPLIGRTVRNDSIEGGEPQAMRRNIGLANQDMWTYGALGQTIRN